MPGSNHLYYLTSSSEIHGIHFFIFIGGGGGGAIADFDVFIIFGIGWAISSKI